MPRGPQNNTTIRADHKYWRIQNRIIKACFMATSINSNICVECKTRRDKGDDALNEELVAIGELVKVDKHGAEHWNYFPHS
jgi:hypothetical protein